MSRPFSSRARAAAAAATKARIDSSVELFRELLVACDEGDSRRAHALQQRLYRKRVAVRVTPPRPQWSEPASVYPVDPRACEDDGAPLELVSVPEFAKRWAMSQRFVQGAVERGWVPCFVFRDRILLDDPIAYAAIHKLCTEHGLCATNLQSAKIPERCLSDE